MTARGSRWMRWTLGPVLALLAFTGCAENAPQDFLEPASEIARQIDGLWDLVFGAAVAVFVVVQGLLIYLLFRFRAKRQSEEPTQIHGNTRMEIAWTIAPAVILAVLAVPTVGTIFSLAEQPEDALEVTVTGWQWWWEYEYPEAGVVTANELHIPTDRPIYLNLKGQDVIHSYWVPKLSGKQDVVPGKDINLTIMAEEPGWYEGQCAEYCGLSHAFMRLRVRAHEPADFERWVASQRAPVASLSGDAAEGSRIFQELACAGCHTVEGMTQGVGGPNLTHFAQRETFAGSVFPVNDENLRSWLADPPEMKPGAKMPDLGLTEDQIDKLVAFLNALD